MKPSELGTTLLKREWLCVILLLLLALILRLTNLTATSMWIDELYSFMVANARIQPELLTTTLQSASQWANAYISWQPLRWETLLAGLKNNVHMPLYYLLLNPWLGLFGNSDFGLRSFSAVISTAMLIPIYLFGKALGKDQRIGLAALLIGALVPFQIYYGQEGRMYALAMFWSAWACLSFWKTLYSARKPIIWGLVYALSATAGLFSHYMFVFILGFHALYLLIWFKGENGDKRRLLYLLPSACSLLGFACWWLPIYQIQKKGLDDDYHFAKGLVNWHRYISLPFWQPLVMIAGSNNLERIFYFPLTLGLFIFYFKSILGKQVSFTLRREGFLCLWVLVPLISQIAYDFYNTSHISVMDRYVLLIAPAMVIGLAIAFARLGQWSKEASHGFSIGFSLRRVLPSILIVGMLIFAILCVMSPSPFRDEHNKTKDLRGKMQYIASHAENHDLVLVNGPWGTLLIAAYYLNLFKPEQPLLYWMSPYRHTQYPLPNKAMLKNYKRVWLLTYRSTNERGLHRMQEYLSQDYLKVKENQVYTLYSLR